MKFKKLLSLTLVGAMTLSLAACGGSSDKAESKTDGEKKAKVEDVKLKVWGPEDEQELLKEMSQKFVEENKGKVNLTIDVSVQSEAEANKSILNDIKSAADVFIFPSDQIAGLANAGALLEVPEKDFGHIKTRNTAGSIEASTVNGKLYGFPKTADNGYFLYYNKQYLTEDDVKTMEGMVAKAGQLGKKVGMEIKSGWYMFSFFQAAGLTTSVDEKGTTKCDWNSTTNKYKGVDVAQSILNLCKQPGFINMDNPVFETGMADGTLIAAVSGAWNAENVKKAWGENYAATKLPTFKCAGDDVQMYSVAGSKIVGVNATTKSQEWALKLADWLTDEEYQTKCCEQKGSGPSNLKATEADVVKNNVALSAFAMQQQWASVQYVGDNYWAPTEEFGGYLVDGNPDGTSLQVLLDNCVKGVELPIQ